MSKAYQRFLEAKFLMYEIEGEPPEVIKEIQESMRDALLEHIAWTIDGQKGSPLPQEMAFQLSTYFRDITAGFSNPYTTPIVKSETGGGVGWHPDEQSCIEDAVKYLKCVDAEKIDDRHPIKTILENYGGLWVKGGLSRDAVKNWKKDPRFKDLDPDKLNPEQVTAMMKSSGRYYEITFTRFARAMLKEERKAELKKKRIELLDNKG